MQWDYGKFILKQLDYSPSFSASDNQLGCASLTICSLKTRARSLIVKYYIKHLMTGHKGNSEFCFPETLNFPLGFASGNIEVEGK